MHARRGVGAAAEGLAPRLDHEVAVLDPRVLGACRVILELVVAEAASAGLEEPLAGVDRCSIEFIGPDEAPRGVHRGPGEGLPAGGPRADRPPGERTLRG